MAKPKPYKEGWRIQIYAGGVRESKTFRTKRECEAWAESRKTELRKLSKLPTGDKHTLAQALAKYRDEVSPGKRGYRWEHVRIESYLKSADLPLSMRISQVTPVELSAWRDARLRVVSPGTVLRDVSLLSSIFEAARLDWGWITSNPMMDVRKPRAPKHRETVISRAEIKQMLRSMGYRQGQCKSATQAVSVAFLLALRTGMRAGEICGLTWDRVYPSYCHVSGKTDAADRDVPLTSKAERLIRMMRGWDQTLVFGIKAQTLDALFRRYRDRAGLSGFRWHDTRHTAATWIARKLHILDLCKIFGWSDTSHALVYYNPKAADIAKRL